MSHALVLLFVHWCSQITLFLHLRVPVSLQDVSWWHLGGILSLDQSLLTACCHHCCRSSNLLAAVVSLAKHICFTLGFTSQILLITGVTAKGIHSHCHWISLGSSLCGIDFSFTDDKEFHVMHGKCYLAYMILEGGEILCFVSLTIDGIECVSCIHQLNSVDVILSIDSLRCKKSSLTPCLITSACLQ